MYIKTPAVDSQIINHLLTQMKNVILLTCFLALQLTSFGQTKKINAHYNWSSVGGNVAFSYEFSYKKIAPFAGVMYHVNMLVSDNRSFAFRHRFYNKNFVDGLGINLGFTTPINIKNSNLGLYFLFINQASHMHNRILLGYCDNTTNMYYTQYSFSNNPLWIFENNVGVGINVKAYDNFYFNASAAFGVVTYLHRDARHQSYSSLMEFSDHLRIGVSYLIFPKLRE